MKTLALLLSSAVVLVPSQDRIDPSSMIFTPSSGGTRVLAQQTLKVVVDAQTLRDVENVITNMPSTSTLSPSAVLALIESHRTTNRDHYTKSENGKPTEIEKMISENQRILLDGMAAKKKVERLEAEIERLRNKKGESSSRSGGGLSGGK